MRKAEVCQQGALAGVLFATGGHAALQAHFLAAACAAQGVAGQRLGGGSGFACSFGNDGIAHEIFPKGVNGETVYLNTFLPRFWRGAAHLGAQGLFQVHAELGFVGKRVGGVA